MEAFSFSRNCARCILCQRSARKGLAILRTQSTFSHDCVILLRTAFQSAMFSTRSLIETATLISSLSDVCDLPRTTQTPYRAPEMQNEASLIESRRFPSDLQHGPPPVSFHLPALLTTPCRCRGRVQDSWSQLPILEKSDRESESVTVFVCRKTPRNTSFASDSKTKRYVRIWKMIRLILSKLC